LKKRGKPELRALAGAKRRTPVAPFPDLHLLHRRHYGVTPLNCGAYAEAASVNLSRHHTPPIQVRVRNGKTSVSRTMAWSVPTPRELAAWANVEDTTRDGAYAVAFAATEMELGLVAIRRAENRSGADYYVDVPGKSPKRSRAGAPTPVLNLENALRLEVSGTHGDELVINSRLKEKLRQTQDARRGPAVACVVGFRECLVLLQSIADGDA
jgi:hypothetical protein